MVHLTEEAGAFEFSVVEDATLQKLTLSIQLVWYISFTGFPVLNQQTPTNLECT